MCVFSSSYDLKMFRTDLFCYAGYFNITDEDYPVPTLFKNIKLEDKDFL